MCALLKLQPTWAFQLLPCPSLAPKLRLAWPGGATPPPPMPLKLLLPIHCGETGQMGPKHRKGHSSGACSIHMHLQMLSRSWEGRCAQGPHLPWPLSAHHTPTEQKEQKSHERKNGKVLGRALDSPPPFPSSWLPPHPNFPLALLLPPLQVKVS